MNQQYYAILIANNQFPEDTNISSLRCPENDVDALGELFTSKAHGVFTRTYPLKNRDSRSVEQMIHKILREANKEDLILIYYSGHGKLDNQGKLYLATCDTRETFLKTTSVSLEHIRNLIDDTRSNKVVLVLDCCYSGAVDKAFLKSSVTDQLTNCFSQGQGIYILTASKDIEVAREGEEGPYSVFTNQILIGIRDGKADRNADGLVSLDELYEYLDEKVPRVQKPMKFALRVQGANLIIARTGKTAWDYQRRKIRRILLESEELPHTMLLKSLDVLSKQSSKSSEEDDPYIALLKELAEENLDIEQFKLRWRETDSALSREIAEADKISAGSIDTSEPMNGQGPSALETSQTGGVDKRETVYVKREGREQVGDNEPSVTQIEADALPDPPGDQRERRFGFRNATPQSDYDLHSKKLTLQNILSLVPTIKQVSERAFRYFYRMRDSRSNDKNPAEGVPEREGEATNFEEEKLTPSEEAKEQRKRATKAPFLHWHFPTRNIVSLKQWSFEFYRRNSLLVSIGLAILAGITLGVILVLYLGLTTESREVAGLASYHPISGTKVLADDGKTVVGEFLVEHRVATTYDQIPLLMKCAILSIEDDGFFQHIGVDPVHMLTDGAPTLTERLVRALFLPRDKTDMPRTKGMLLALAIERNYTKEQIMEMYCNEVFLGGNIYGFEAAARYYFSKPLKELALAEYALLAGLAADPNSDSPIADERAAFERRNRVLDRMQGEGYINQEQRDKALQTIITLNLNLPPGNENSVHDYFVEEVRQESEDTFGTEQTQTAGMSIYTTLDPVAQREAVRAVRRGLHAYEDRHGKHWRGKLPNILDQVPPANLFYYSHPDWIGDYVASEYIYGLVMRVSPSGVDVRFGDYRASLTEPDTKWAGAPPSKLLRKGDLAVFKINKADNDKKILDVTLDQLPSVEGALVCLESKTGDVKAMVGGYDFATRKFNNATQAERQTGSTFKPFIYAAAVENGFTPDTIVSCQPYVDPVTGWSPANYDGSSGGGLMPLRSALQQSLNVVPARLLSIVGVDKGSDIVKRFGLANPMKRVLPAALGTTEEPLIDMVSAYSAFSNQGERVKPHLIKRVTDANGDVKQEWKPESAIAISPWVAQQMQIMMRGVITGGTAGSMMANNELAKRMICGETGTVNDFTDAWFIGYTPTYTAGVWIGYPVVDPNDPPGTQTLGNKETGSAAALPMWIHFMEKFLKDKPNDQFPKNVPLDKEVLARRSEAERAVREAVAGERKPQTTTRDRNSTQSRTPLPQSKRPPRSEETSDEKKKRGRNG